MGVLNHLSTLLLLSLLPPALSHVVTSFTECEEFFLDRTTPNLLDILVGGKVQDRYKLICQKYNNIYRFATLYDMTNRIPVFSAYTFTAVTNNQAANTDYLNNEMDLTRGHLFPCSYAPDAAAKKSTFTLTNIVPQYGTFNGGSWNAMEGDVRTTLMENCKNNNQIKAYVVTGAVPSKNRILKNRVNIPDLLWTAYCCKNNLDLWVAGAHWGENVPDTMKTTLNPETLGKLEDKLNEIYNNVKVFPEKCPRNSRIVEAVNKGKRNNEGEGAGESSKKKQRTSRQLNECKEDGCDEEDGCDDEDVCDCDCDEK
uniref:Uncharacterized protein n=1 Tax=Hucho hucho TaxID=62062 RepID=A0A4W5LG79_9TELE